MKVKNIDEFDPETQTIVLLSDVYGAKGEWGTVLSEKFMKHDAYCMFDALMNGTNGSVAMAEFFISTARHYSSAYSWMGFTTCSGKNIPGNTTSFLLGSTIPLFSSCHMFAEGQNLDGDAEVDETILGAGVKDVHSTIDLQENVKSYWKFRCWHRELRNVDFPTEISCQFQLQPSVTAILNYSCPFKDPDEIDDPKDFNFGI
ncbi:hypothetical protein K1719_015579 [Acacia pycnantha]|nr:hypothetical protein K1719_015579 [Acacia pycnantha]